MIECIITIAVLGLMAGFFFSIPVAGPISILITSNALKGKLRFALRTAIGASVAEFFYVFLAIYGIALLYESYQSFIPYILIFGSGFLFFVGLKIMRTKIKLDEIDETGIIKDKLKNKGGLRTGLILNLSNPSLFIGWLTSSFLLFSFASGLGLNTGGLDLIVNENVQSISELAGEDLGDLAINPPNVNTDKVIEKNSVSSILLSLIYAVSVSLGSYIWFHNFTKVLIKFRQKFKVSIINKIILILGVCLLGIASYLIYQAIIMLISK